MAKAVLKAAGGLSAADKETARQWMVEGHEILRGRVAGSIPARGAATITPGTSDQVLAAGQYLEGAQTIKGDANLAAGNIRSGVSIFGVAGGFAGNSQIAFVAFGGGGTPCNYVDPGISTCLESTYFSRSGSSMVCKVAGTYTIYCNVVTHWANGGGRCGFEVYRNSTRIINASGGALTSSTGNHWYSSVQNFAVGDTVYCRHDTCGQGAYFQWCGVKT